MKRAVSHPTNEQIRARAYELYVAHGRVSGHAIDDWLQAEYELMQLPLEKIATLQPPPPTRVGTRHSALAALVQTALILGAEALPHFNR